MMMIVNQFHLLDMTLFSVRDGGKLLELPTRIHHESLHLSWEPFGHMCSIIKNGK